MVYTLHLGYTLPRRPSFSYFGDAFALSQLGSFEGIYHYSLAHVENLALTEARASRVVHNCWKLADSPRSWVFAATAQPGCDDRMIPGRKGTVLERRDGVFLRETFESAIKSRPDWIFLSTWNEWWENTEIEPGERYGSRYLEITREYAQKWNGASKTR